MTEQNERRLCSVVVELADKRCQYFLDRKLAVVAREVGAVPPILATAKEEHLNAGLSARLMRGDHVGIDDPRDVDVLMPLDQRQGPDSIANQRRRFKIENFRCSLHFSSQSLLHVIAAAGQKNPCLVDQRRIVLATNATHAGRAAPLDLMQQARACANRENAVAAGPQQERLL